MYVANKVAVITGGAIGLGFLYAKELLKNELKGVTLADVNIEKGEEAVENLTQEYGPGKVIFVKTNVTNKSEFENAIRRTVEVFGNFDILINNAGIFDDSNWEAEVDVNFTELKLKMVENMHIMLSYVIHTYLIPVTALTVILAVETIDFICNIVNEKKGLMNGCLLAYEEFLPKYKSGESEPIIVNISSIGALRPAFFVPVYCATKYAVVAIGKCLAQKENYESQKVKVVTVCPAATSTTILDNIHTKSFTKRLVPVTLQKYGKIREGNIQTPEVMAAAMIKVIENAENGDIWMVDDGDIYQVEVPELEDLKILKRLE